MKEGRRKRNSNRGASLLIAMVYVLMALTVGIVVLTAASSNAGRITHNRQEQQEYFAVKSAAELVKRDFSGASFVRTVVVDNGTQSETGTLTHGDLLKAKKLALSQLLENGTPLTELPLSFSVKDSGGAAVAALPTVKGSLTVERSGRDCVITVRLACVGETGEKSNPVTLEFPGTITDSEEVNATDGEGIPVKTTHTTRVEWETPSVKKGVLS